MGKMSQGQTQREKVTGLKGWWRKRGKRLQRGEEESEKVGTERWTKV